ncbi:AAA family ATPase [Nocardioides stalactiti]|uniref:AAA family ATPase n=1 Tax=Nocardioides stalactiti TaxID=2755356 RepID=UPI001602E046|nr:AAA family ATPase [Nocardioides stalactiti]
MGDDELVEDVTSTDETAIESETRSVVKFRRLSEMTTTPTKWLAVGNLPASAVAVLVGDEGIGKSLWWVWVVSHLTTGRASPTIGYAGGEPVDVLVIATEDGAGELNDRLTLAGADRDRVHVLSEDKSTAATITINSNSPEVEAAVETLREEGRRVGLVVVDAWLDTVPDNLNVRSPQDARRALKPWSATAERFDVCVLLVAHTNRMDTGNVRDKYGATGALRQKARQTLYAARSPEGTLLVGTEKGNHAEAKFAVAYEVDVVQVRTASSNDPGKTARLKVVGTTGSTVRDHIAAWHTESREAGRAGLGAAMTNVLAYVNAHDGVVASEVATALEIETDTAGRYLRRLRDNGQVGQPHERGAYISKSIPDTQVSVPCGCPKCPKCPELVGQTGQTGHVSATDAEVSGAGEQ